MKPIVKRIVVQDEDMMATKTAPGSIIEFDDGRYYILKNTFVAVGNTWSEYDLELYLLKEFT